MRKFHFFVTLFLLASFSTAHADNYYTYATTTYHWDGTAEKRFAPPTADYTSTYGDEASVTYTLPWAFTFYGQSFSQITADTNGNIWFGNSGAAHSFNLASNGKGPVIAAWNNDLSSYPSGGVFIQHKTSPEERVVVEWQTDTYTNEGRRKPNTFEVVLFQTGSIRVDYKSFAASSTNKDFGSGISLNDGVFNVNLTSGQDSVFNLGGQSFLFTASGSTTNALNVKFIGNGKGVVASNVGVSWTATASANLPTGSQITLHATPNLGSRFDGWRGSCSGTGNCSLSLNSDTTATAIFSPDTPMQLILASSGSQYTSLQTAYNSVLTDSTLKAVAAYLMGDFTADLEKAITIQGGYNVDFSNNLAGQSVLYGIMTITSGEITIDGLTIQ